MPTIVGIFNIYEQNNILSEPEKTEFLDIFILVSIQNFMLNWVEHEKKYSPGARSDATYHVASD